MMKRILTVLAAALAAGLSPFAVIGATTPAASKLSFNLKCYPYFQKVEDATPHYYTCRRVFRPLCGKGFRPQGAPVFIRRAKSAYSVRYGCKRL